MAKPKQPVVLLVDDSDEHLTAYGEALRTRTTVIARHPQDVTGADLRKSNVVLVDFVIDDWRERDDTPTISLQPRNGVALAAILRSHSEAPSREHAIARTLNLEWVFRKEGGSGSSMPEQVCELAHAMAALPRMWPEDRTKATQLVLRLLSTPAGSKWASRAKADVEACRPPAYAAANATNGLAVVRWLLHQVLPYPCFLWDVHYLGARLRVTPESVAEALRTEQKARRALSTVAYGGILSGFLGPRWWRVGVEQVLWDWTKGDPFDSSAIRNAVIKHVSPNLQHVEHSQAVVSVDSSFRPSPTLIDIADAVEVRPDDWPAYADQAWVKRSEAEDDSDLAAMVPQQDRPLAKAKAP
jgi:hypothetical protein